MIKKDKDIAIKIENLTKVYHLYDRPQDIIKELFHPFRKSYHHDFYAMDDVSFSIPKGQTIGIIGKNGAGKSTLLKMITGVLTPTKGTITTQGKIASLLELGAGFSPEMTGLENIFLNGTLMGFSKQEIDHKIEDILEFADIGEFIHQPVKMYSSGMFARLAFAVSINVEPDILIVDEALSVGDMAFQMKCFKKFQDFQKEGRTILFVTHSLDTVLRYCTRGIVIDEGKIVFDNTPKLAVDAFKKVLSNNFYKKEENKATPYIENEVTYLKDSFELNKSLDMYGNGKATIIDFGILDSQNKPSPVLHYNEDFKIIMKIKFSETLMEPIFAFTIKDTKGLEITGTNTSMKHVITSTYDEEREVLITFSQKANFQLGTYSLSLGCVGLNETGIEVYNRIYDAIVFDVIGTNQMVGFYDLQSEISIN